MDEDQVELEGIIYTEFAQGCVQCAKCNYWGNMEGFVKPDDNKFIHFVCPECQAVERVTNPLAI